MEPRVTGALLWSRALLVGSLVALLGTAGHVSAGGLLPPTWVVAALVALTVVGCAPRVRGRSRRLAVRCCSSAVRPPSTSC